MTELSLHGYTNLLSDITDQTRMSDELLRSHIGGLESILKQAQIVRLGNQASAATRLLTHYGFELSQRFEHDVSPIECLPEDETKELESVDVK